ncbi:MAG TPA: hydroxymethylglutaryl-CoA lyase [Chthoniobacterales bacterium]|nr:hydroxymethylglutaryl-CoA lyase [Chthoniobacterales bacterium]
MANAPIKLIECPRDAWQGLPRHLPSETKLQYLRALIAAGFKHIDAASFVSPKAVPQMADSEEVLQQINVPPGVEIIGIVVNEKGADRAIATKRVSTLGYPCSISPTFLRRNQNQSTEENFDILTAIKHRADKAHLDLVVYISMAFGNPYGDPWSRNQLASAITEIAQRGVRSISLADTVGLAEAAQIGDVVTGALAAAADCEIGVHLHSTRADATEKILAAYDAGCRRLDSAIGGLGGCPFAQNTLVGNIPTESVVAALGRRGVDLPLKLERVIELNAEISADEA